MTPTYRITTLGCRVNAAETRELESLLRARGLAPASTALAADLEVVHSCSVTNAAAAKSRNAVRRAARRQRSGADAERAGAGDAVVHGPHQAAVHTTVHAPAPATEGSAAVTAAGLPRSLPSTSGPLGRRPVTAGPHAEPPRGAPGRLPPKVIVTGCYAATHPREAATLVGAPTGVVAHEDGGGPSLMDRFAEEVDRWLAQHRDSPTIRTPSAASSGGIIPLPVIPPGTGTSRHVRAELRIQDGCDAHCTFCIIPRIRRTLRSKPIRDAVGEARRLVDLGHRELVLTGIFLGAYGHATALRRRQRPGVEGLADLLDAIAGVPGLARLRLSSLEPGDVTEALLDAMLANRPTVVPHLHLPLQSGSDPILRRMNRQYTVGDYLDMVDAVNGALTDDGLPPALTTDVICGFPGSRARTSRGPSTWPAASASSTCTCSRTRPGPARPRRDGDRSPSTTGASGSACVASSTSRRSPAPACRSSTDDAWPAVSCASSSSSPIEPTPRSPPADATTTRSSTSRTPAPARGARWWT